MAYLSALVFSSPKNPEKRARAIVMATTYYNDPKILAEISYDLGEEMEGIDLRSLSEHELLSLRGN